MSKRLKYIHCGRLEAIKNTICYGYVEQNKHYIYYHTNFSILSNIIPSDFGYSLEHILFQILFIYFLNATVKYDITLFDFI